MENMRRNGEQFCHLIALCRNPSLLPSQNLLLFAVKFPGSSEKCAQYIETLITSSHSHGDKKGYFSG